MSSLSAGPEPAFMVAAPAIERDPFSVMPSRTTPSGAGAQSDPPATFAATDSATSAPAPPGEANAQGATPSPQPKQSSSNPIVRAAGQLGHALHSLGSDMVYVVTSPGRINRKGAMWTAATIGGGAALYAYDQELYDATQRSRGNPAYDAILDVGTGLEPVGLMGRTWPYWTGLWAVGKVTRVEVLQQIPAEVLESHFIAGGIRNTGKLFVGRRRPFEHYGPRQFEFNGGTSFPSGHTSVAFEIATVLSHHAKLWPVTVATYGLASTVAVQRVDDGTHWASDCFIPAITGTVIARVVIRRNEERRAQALRASTDPIRPGSRLMVVPVALRGGGGVLLETRF